MKRYDANLTDVALNCSVDVNPLIFTIIADVTIVGVFEVTCS